MESSSSNSSNSFSYKGRRGAREFCDPATGRESLLCRGGINFVQKSGMGFSGVAADGWLLHNLLLILKTY